MEDYKINVGYLYKDSFSEKEFIKAVLKYIAQDSSSPSYIFDEMVCSSVSRINIPLILCDGQSEIQYSRMVGYDRIETTTKYITTTYGNGYQDKKRRTSCRTITDWKRDSGTINGCASSGTYDDNYKVYDEYVTNHVMDKNNIRQLTGEELSQYKLTQGQIDYLKNDILNKVFEENITYPGNHIKDEEYYDNTTLYNISCTIVSLYNLSITVRDKNIQFIACSNGDIEIKQFGEYPIDNYEDVLNFTRQMSSERNEATKKERHMAKITILSTLILFAISLILGIVLHTIALSIISVIILVIGLIIWIRIKQVIKIISRPYNKRIFEYNTLDYEKKLQKKQDAYLKYLANNNL